MACVTLKRPLEFDPIHHSPGAASSCSPRPHKRRRCLPMCIPASHVNTSFTQTPTLSASSFAALPHTSRSSSASPFVDATPGMLQGDIAQYVCEEIRRLKRRRLLASVAPPSPPPSSDSRSTMDVEATENPASPPCITSPSLTTARPASSPTNKDKPLFSFRQVNQVCEQLLRERESRVREEYDGVLARELADQYSRCVKFTTEQIRRHLDRQELPSYMS